MSSKDFTLSFTVEQTPDAVFQAINQVPSWWSGEVRGESGKLGDEFSYEVPGVHYSKQKIAEFAPGRKLVWHVTDAQLDRARRKDEWKGTDIVFEIEEQGAKTELRFTHRGLSSAFECYQDCSNAWGMLVNGNLKRFITSGQPQPSPW